MNNQFRESAKTLENAVERSASFHVRSNRNLFSNCKVVVEFTSDIEDKDYEQDISFYDDRIIVYLSDETSLVIYEETVKICSCSCISGECSTIDEYDVEDIRYTQNLIVIDLVRGNTIGIIIRGEGYE